MSSQRYYSLGVPGARAWEMEEHESEYRPQGLTTEVSSVSLLSDHEFTSEYDLQQNLESAQHQHNGNANSYPRNASVNGYPQNFGAGAIVHPSEVYMQNHAASLTSEHIDVADANASPEADLGSLGQPLRRFYFRTIVGILGPVMVVCYLITIWRIYLAPLHPDSTVAFGPQGAKWVFYSWFVAGVIGLSLSLYGLAGAEAGMLMERNWRVQDAMRLMLHADNTWSGPGGWMKAFKWAVQMRRLLPPPRLLNRAQLRLQTAQDAPLSMMVKKSSSAKIDGVRSTYSNFQRSDTPVPTLKNKCAKRFGAETLACTLNINDDGWLKWLFDSIGLPSPLGTTTGNTEIMVGNLIVDTQVEYLQADQLRQALLQAYSTYAIKLMYNDGQDFISENGTRLKSHVPDLTAFVAGTVIEPGVMPAAVPVALFGLWALISSGLCLVYGFRRRWSAILDGHTVFRLGAELQQTYRARLQLYSTIADIEECETLHEIPGFVADMDPDDDVGRIGLMDGKPARKDKLYR
ncbi:hypothetical protein J4E93_003310 [Alternaria ventricosa]|uniref:uncharacterized protein n=1 Tax=Alternaria ventricosa TaxID=1187951 RepID=UPI0020C32C57|nr:uncharacterized protein J4E93_003310 [Alternaria ventricosa]KAI4650953.1 hypothetical protein J4E93_003310 [Alternaria ventricosa]